MTVEIPSLDTIIGYVPPLDTVVVDYVNRLETVSKIASRDRYYRVISDQERSENVLRVNALNDFVGGDRGHVDEIQSDVSDFAVFYVPGSYFEGEAFAEKMRLDKLVEKAGNVGLFSFPLYFASGAGFFMSMMHIIPEQYTLFSGASFGLMNIVQMASAAIGLHYATKRKSAWKKHDERRDKVRKELNIPIPSDGLCAALLNNRDYIVEKLDKYRQAEVKGLKVEVLK